MEKVRAYAEDAYGELKGGVDELRSEVGGCIAITGGTVGEVVYSVPTGKYFSLRHYAIHVGGGGNYVDFYEGTANAASDTTRKLRAPVETIGAHAENIRGKVFTADVSVQVGTSVSTAVIDVGGILYTP